MVTLCGTRPLHGREHLKRFLSDACKKSAKPSKRTPFARKNIITARQSFAKPRVFIPVFPEPTVNTIQRGCV